MEKYHFMGPLNDCHLWEIIFSSHEIKVQCIIVVVAVSLMFKSLKHHWKHLFDQISVIKSILAIRFTLRYVFYKCLNRYLSGGFFLSKFIHPKNDSNCT